MSDDILWLPISQLAPKLRRKEISPVELARLTLDRIARLEPKLNSYITVLQESALREASAAEKEMMSGRYRGPLHGVPISVKDIYAIKGVRTTAGSKILRDSISDDDATVVLRLRKAGAVLVGKTNLHEFSYGVTSNNPHFGPVHNPWDLRRVPGGSSGGSAAAVASALCAASMGSDSGGSIRIPSAACGTSGIKPTYGRVSRFRVVPLAWSVDHAGPLARTAEDAAFVLQAIAGYDPNDETSDRKPVPDYAKSLTGSVRGLRLGIPQNYFFEHIDSEIEWAVHAAVKILEGAGAKGVPVTLPHLEHSPGMAAQITLVEATSYHEPFMKKHIDDYGEEPRTKLEAGMYFLATDYVKSQRARTLLRQSFDQAFRNADVILAPTLPAFPPAIEEVFVKSGDLREHVVDAFTRLNIPCNLTGLPAMSVPCGFGANGLPIGLQIIGRAFDESTVLRVGHAYQSLTDWHRKTPTGIAG